MLALSELSFALALAINSTTISDGFGVGLPKIPGSDVTLDNVMGHSAVKYTLTKPSDVDVGGDGPWPFIGFFHALTMQGGEINGYSDLLTAVAKRGFIILTLRDFPHVKPNEACHLVWDTLRGAQAQLGLGGYADFSRLGIFGHSMGGGETISAMSMPDECGPYDTLGPLAAAVAMHPWMFEAPQPMPAAASCPAMYLTGTKDTNVKPADVKAAYDASPQQKIFANGEGRSSPPPPLHLS